MAFGGLSNHTNAQNMAEINMIPLIDVMLVLLVIFIITAPMMTNAVKIKLPTASSAPNPIKPEMVQITINAQHKIYWNKDEVSTAALAQKMQNAAALSTQPELQIRADGDVAYQYVAAVMAQAASAGLDKLGFVTDPKSNH
ncbi:MAG: biopolymer transporter ExbD [Sulfuriferula sp.]|nr:biopolymer transporter ExbD [Sulfuriferula sp.]